MQLDGQTETTGGDDQPPPNEASLKTGAQDAYVPAYEYDIFLSYAQDNNSDLGSGRGWVDHFLLGLQKTVNDKLTEDGKVRIFIDKGEIAPNGSLSDTVRNAVNRSALLVIIFSPRYLTREWCKQERDTFIAAAGGIEQARRRLFVISYEDVATNRIPAELQDSLRIEFFERSLIRQFTRPLQFDLPSHQEKYNEQLYFTAEHVANTLNQMRRKESPRDLPHAVKPSGRPMQPLGPQPRAGVVWISVLAAFLLVCLFVGVWHFMTPEPKLQVIVSVQLATQIAPESEQIADSAHHWTLEIKVPGTRPMIVDPYYGQSIPLDRKSIPISRGDTLHIRLRSPSKECIEWSWEVPASSHDFILDEKPFVSCP